MALFKVTRILDSGIIEVSGWKWGEYRGKKVKIAGYEPRRLDQVSFAKNKLQILLNEKQVELKNVISVEKQDDGDVITCSVYLNDVDIAQYFPEFSS